MDIKISVFGISSTQLFNACGSGEGQWTLQLSVAFVLWVAVDAVLQSLQEALKTPALLILTPMASRESPSLKFPRGDALNPRGDT
jgi:hypothetical protein